MSSKYGFLGHKYEPFNKPNILETSKYYGFEHRDSVETHLWVYELYYQIQTRAGKSCVLKGGACAQLYLPVQIQRCTLDLDLATSLTSKDLIDLLESITTEFKSHRFYSEFKEYIPRRSLPDTKLIPMKTYLINLPFIYKRGRKGGFPDIKLDFVFLSPDEFPTTYIENGKTFGLELKYSPFCLTQYSIICNKLLTLAAGTIGLDFYKIESFYKNIYDLYQLINEYNNLNCFKAVSEIIAYNIRLEFSLKNLEPIKTDLMLEDILSTLHHLFVFDLLVEEPKASNRIMEFEKKCIQDSVRQELNPDTWAIMMMFIYIWVHALIDYISDGNTSILEIINEILDNYDYYLSLDKKERRKLIRTYKNDIFQKDTRLMLSKSINPLRIIYLNFILNKLF